MHFGFIEGITAGTRYGLRAEGPWRPEDGHRFDPAKLLLDPYALAIDGPFRHHADLTRRGSETSGLVPKAIAVEVAAHAAPLPPHRPEFIYEIPVRAFTRLHPDIPPEQRGTVAALAHPAIIAHLKRIGVDTVELMPLAAWIDERHLPPLGLSNAWGYNPVSFMAPDPRVAPGGLPEIRQTVEALHAAGIRVVLDVVFNHSGESDEHGATVSMRGLDNALYYRHAEGVLVNDTGCGNTLALSERPVVRLVMDAMRSWVSRTGIDGFRFDLAPVLGRVAHGFDTNAPLFAAIEQDPLLSRLIMIAEPWDVGPGGYRLGGFPARWHEWNDRYRDEVRQFWRGDAHGAGALATRVSGSSDIFAPYRSPSAGINYLAAHDGFTLKDAVTYTIKNNFANGEDNRDGNAHEPTWPRGDIRALLATLFLSRGTPMLTAGDEFGRTQRGNNNAYAQDNETTWLDWAAADQSLIASVAELAELRRSLQPFLADRFLTGERSPGCLPDAEWIGADGGPMNWHDPDAAIICLLLSDGARRIALCFNRSLRDIAPPLPARDGHKWQRLYCSTPRSKLPAQSVAVFAEERLREAGLSDAGLMGLAAEAGIATEWWEVDGTHHAVSPETLRLSLEAMGLACRTVEDSEASRQLLREAASPLVVAAGAHCAVGAAAPLRRTLHHRDEAGHVRSIVVPPGDEPRLALEPGYHEIRWAEDGPVQHVIATPGACYSPEELSQGQRVFGLASHLYALRHAGDGGIGDFETLRRFGALAERLGGRYAGLNPLHHLFPSDRSRASPYQPSDRRYVDPIYINLDRLLSSGRYPKAAALAGRSRAAFAALESLKDVDYKAVWTAKAAVLEAAFAEFTMEASYERFVSAGGDDLIRHGQFEAGRAGESPTPSRIAYRAFLQWVADQQLGEAAACGNLYRDLALGCAFDGGEIAEGAANFAHGISIGAPPDPFSAAGQVWNLPPLSPLQLRASGLKPMRTILAANMRHAAALRIDHILGFARQFWVPRGAEGKHGTYVRYPMEALIAVTAIESQRSRCLIVGEDLGTVPDGLRSAMAAAHILSYRVLWFERDGAGFRMPESYPPQALACLASHDLPTFKGWRMGRDIAINHELGLLPAGAAHQQLEARAGEVAALDRLTGAVSSDLEAASAAAHAFVARTPSQIMLIQADDMAGETEPLNVPGTDTERPNWRRRIATPVDDLDGAPLALAIVAAVRKERHA